MYPAFRQPFQPGPIEMNHVNVALPPSRRTKNQVTAIGRPRRRIIDFTRGPLRNLKPLFPIRGYPA